MRDYRKEYKKDMERDTFIRIRLHKEDAEKFKEKLESEHKTISEFLKEKINEYLYSK